jgi:NAD+ synthetase
MRRPIQEPPEDDDTEAAYRALVLGTRDYVRKCGFRKALVGLSGGIDSALVAAIAKDALGAENVLGIGMPSPYSSPAPSTTAALAANLGIRFEVIGISGLFEEYTARWSRCLPGTKPDTTEENIQSRIRGCLLMALSNKFSALVLTTGNKSEMAVGYCTLYGDMVGALAVIGDLVKTRVYAVCRWLNRDGEVIPPGDPRKAALGRAAPGPEGHRLAAALRGARSDSRSLRGALRDPGADRRGTRISARTRPTGGAPGGALRVQAPAGRAGPEGDLKSRLAWAADFPSPSKFRYKLQS